MSAGDWALHLFDRCSRKNYPGSAFRSKSFGAQGLKSHDARRWQSNPELNVSLDYLKAIFSYLAQNGIGMYRMSSDLAPYVRIPTCRNSTE